MEKTVKREEWTTIIKPKSNFFRINIREILHYRDLVWLLIKRDIKAIYKQTILGPFWHIIQPLLTTVVFTIVFGNIAKIPTDGAPKVLFYLSGTIIWQFFAKNLNKISTTFVVNAKLFGKVYFPRLIVPITTVTSNLISFGIQVLLLIGFLIYYIVIGSTVRPNLYLLFLPLLILQVSLLGMGAGLIISALTNKYRDLKFLVGFGIQLLMYATPIVYPMSQIPDKWQFVFMINPMAIVVELFKYSFLGIGEIRIVNIIVSVSITLVVFVFGVLLFNFTEKTFMDKV